MSNPDFDISMIGDKELLRALENLDYKTQHKELKRILRDTATQTFVKRLRQASPKGKTGNLKRSMGHVSGKSRRVATIFAGPRMSVGKRREGSKEHSGWLANIIEFNKHQPRYPGVDKYGRKRKRPMLPDGSIRKHSGVFPLGPFVVRTILNTIRMAEEYEMKAVRKLIQKEWNKYTKK